LPETFRGWRWNSGRSAAELRERGRVLVRIPLIRRAAAGRRRAVHVYRRPSRCRISTIHSSRSDATVLRPRPGAGKRGSSDGRASSEASAPPSSYVDPISDAARESLGAGSTLWHRRRVRCCCWRARCADPGDARARRSATSCAR
jgi:hypothetical protein